MTDFKVRRPKIAVVGAALAMVCAVLGVTALSLTLRGAILGIEAGYEASDIEIVLGSWVFLVASACCVVVFAGGILILRRRYRLGGLVALIPSVFLAVSTVNLWYVGVWGITGGILGLIAKEETPRRVLEIVKQQGQISIKEVAALTGKSELDVEVAIVELKSKGQPIRYDMKTRNVIHAG